jgi:signal transduction histidine kinase
MFGLFEKKVNRILQPEETLQKRLDAVIEINKAIVGILDLQKILDLITNRLVSVIDVSFASVWVWESDKRLLRLQSASVPKIVKVLSEKAMGNPITSTIFNLDNPEHQKSDYVKCLLEGKLIKSYKLYNLSYPLVDKTTSAILQKLMGMKIALSIPLITKDQKLGILSAVWKREIITPDEETIVMTFADQIGTAIYNAKLFDQSQAQIHYLEKKNHELFSLYTLTSNVSQSLDPDTVAQIAVDSLPQDKSMIGGIISWVNDETHTLYPIAVTKNDISSKAQTILGDFSKYAIDLNNSDIQENTYIKVIKTGKVHFTSDLTECFSPPIPKKLMPAIAKLLSIKSIVIYPVLSRGKIVGTASYLLTEKTYDELEESEQQLYATYTFQIAIALENSRLYRESIIIQQKLEARNKQLETIYQFTNKVTASLNITEISQKALDELPQILGYTAAFYCPLDKENKKVHSTYFTLTNEKLATVFNLLPKNVKDYSLSYEDPKNKDNIVVQVLNSEKITLTKDISNLAGSILPDFILKKAQDLLGIKTIIVAPVKRENQIVAVLIFLVSDKEPEEISQLELDTLTVISGQIGVSLENANLYEKTMKAYAELQQAYDRDKDMIDILGHELRTPATICKGNIELLQDYLKKEEMNIQQREFLLAKLQAAYGAIIQETGLINELLSATKLDSGQLVITNETIDLHELAKGECANYQEIAKKQNLELRYIEPLEPIPATLGDRIRLLEVIDNLISNAIKYTREGYIEMYVQTDHKNVYFHIKDTGMGIEKEELEGLFQKFHRINNYVSKSSVPIQRPGGTGLGLWVAKGIIEAHKGRVWVESDGPGKGSTFSFSIPVRNLSEITTTPQVVDEVDMFEKLGLKRPG